MLVSNWFNVIVGSTVFVTVTVSMYIHLVPMGDSLVFLLGIVERNVAAGGNMAILSGDEVKLSSNIHDFETMYSVFIIHFELSCGVTESVSENIYTITYRTKKLTV